MPKYKDLVGHAGMLGKKEVYYLKQIPKVPKIIKKHFSTIKGVIEITVNIRVVNTIVAYVYLDKEVYTRRFYDKRESVRLLDVGIKPKNKNSKERFPRILLEVMKAQENSESEVRKQFPQLKIDWVAFLKKAGTKGITPIDIM